MSSGNGERVLVTGSSGYIATHIVQQLQEAGYQVRGTVRSVKNEEKVAPLKKLAPNAQYPLELVEADLTKDDGWAEAVQDCKFVLHTASPFPASDPKHEDELIKPAVEGTLRVLRAVSDSSSDIKRVVLTSSCAAIADFTQPHEKPFTEADWFDINSKGASAYSKSKTLAEKAAWDFVDNLPAGKKFELAVINPSLVFGPVLCGSPGTSVNVLKQIMAMPMAPEIAMPYVDVRDVAKAHVKAMVTPDAAGHRHIASPYTMTILEWSKALNEEFADKGYKAPTKKMPNVIVKILGCFSKDARQMSSMLGLKHRFDITRMRTVLGIEPIEAKRTLTDTVYSMIDRGYIEKKPKYYNPNAQ